MTKSFLSVFPFIVFPLTFLATSGVDILTRQIYLVIIATLFVIGVVISIFFKSEISDWQYIWGIFGSMFAIFSIDHYQLFLFLFPIETKGASDFIFPGQISKIGIIFLLLFYLIINRHRKRKRINDSTIILIVISYLYCYYLLYASYYHGVLILFQTESMSIVRNAFSPISSLITGIVFAIILLFIQKKRLNGYKWSNILFFVFLIFFSMHFLDLFLMIKYSGWSSMLNLYEIKYIFILNIKYIWLMSGVLYLILFVKLKAVFARLVRRKKPVARQ